MKRGLILIAFLFFLSFASAFDFYQGGISVESVSTDIEVDNASASVNSVYLFSGTGSAEVDLIGVNSGNVEIDGVMTGSKFSVSLDGEKAVNVSYAIPLDSSESKSLIYNPSFTLDGLFYPSEVKHSINVKMPRETNGFARVSRNYVSSQFQFGKNVFVWNEQRYLLPLVLEWNTLNLHISVLREIPKEIDGEFEIKLTISNYGTADAENLVIEDNFMPDMFEPVSPEIETIVSEQDTRLVWRKEIPVLKPEESLSFSYKLKADKGISQLAFNPLVVTSNGILILSTERTEYINPDVEVIPLSYGAITSEAIEENKIQEKVSAFLSGEETTNEKTSSSGNLKNIIFFALLVVVIAVAVVYLLRKRNKVNLEYKQDNFSKLSSELQNYIREASERGYSREKIVKELEKNGWTAEQINKAYDKLNLK